jgi:TP901 family phage tail tape measure protein
VQARRAQAQLAQVQAQMRALQAQAARTSTASAGLGAGAALANLTRLGNRLQWFGRQLSYNFSLPLALAGAAAVKWELQNEQAMIRVRKVYGDASLSAATMNNELNALSGAFEALSNQYGVQIKDVEAIAGDWAAAGSSGLALAKATELTMRTMVLGEIDATKATQALIAIQAQFGLVTDDSSNKVMSLRTVIEMLNTVENQTGVSMAGLIDALSRSAGVARSAGVSVEQLAAMTAALVPAAGTAANAGNALKTIISRLMSPTQEAVQVFRMLGVNTADAGWKSLNAADRLKLLADKYTELNDKANKASGSQKRMISAQLAIVSTVAASRWQISRFDILMREMASSNGYYAKTLEAVADKEAVHRTAVKELNTVLQSNPQRVRQIGVILQNSLIDVIQPLIPLIVYLGQVLARAATWIENLSPSVQKLGLAFLAFLALAGPLISRFAVILQLIGYLGEVLIATGGALARVFLAPFRLIGSVVLGAISYLAGFTAAVLSIPAMIARASIGSVVARVLIGPFAALTPAVTAALAGLSAAIAAWGTAVAATVTGALSTAFLGAMAIFEQIARDILMYGMGPVLRALVAPFLVGSVSISAIMASIATVVSGWMARIGLMLSPITSVFSSALIAVRDFVFVWGGTLVAGFAASMRGVGAAMMLVPALARVAATRLWATLTIYGAFTGALYRGWLILSTRMTALWTMMWGGVTAIATRGMLALTTVFSAGAAGLMRGWTFLLTSMTTMWTAALAFLRSTWIRTLLFLAGGGLFRGIIAMFTALPTILAAVGTTLFAVLTSPWTLAIAAILGVIYVFRDQVAQIFANLVGYFQNLPAGAQQAIDPFVNVIDGAVRFVESAFNLLPNSIQSAMSSVVQVVANAAMQVYSLFSYLNPFAHHSPSLVENVTKGMKVVSTEFKKSANSAGASMKNAHDNAQKFSKAGPRSVAGDIASAKAAQGSFENATAPFRNGMDKLSRAQDRADVAKWAKGALPSFDALVGRMKTLNRDLDLVGAAVDRQQAVVDGWQKRLDAASKTLDKMNDRLDKLKDVQSAASDALDANKQSITDFANTPIKGMRRLEDQIFNNDIATKKLQLRLLKLGDAGDIDKLRDKMAKLQGEIESARGRQADLRSRGAGSEITGVYDKQVASLQKQQGSLTKQSNAVQKINDQLARLGKQSQILDLTKSINYDPLVRQLQQMADTTKEMSFDQLVRSIRAAQAQTPRLQAAYDRATRAVDAQTAAVNAQKAARDAIQDRLDNESDKLDAIKKQYQDIKDTVDNLNTSLNQMSQLANDAKQRAEEAARAKRAKKVRLTPGAQNFIDAKGGTFPDVGGNAKVGREGGTADQSAAIKKFTDDLAKQTGASIGTFDMFKPFKDMWKSAVSWLRKQFGPLGTVLSGGFKAAFQNVSNPFETWNLESKAKSALAGVQSAFDTVASVISSVWRLLGPEVQQFFQVLMKWGSGVLDKLAPHIKQFSGLWEPLKGAFHNIMIVAKILGIVLGVVLLGAIKVLASVFVNVLGPALDTITSLIGVSMDIIYNIIRLILAVIALDWKTAWKALVGIVASAFKLIWIIIKGAARILWGAVKGLVKGVFGWFKWLWNELVGHSIVPDTIKAIIFWWNKLTAPIRAVWNAIWNVIKAATAKISAFLRSAWAATKALIIAPVNLAKKAIDVIWSALRRAFVAVKDWVRGAWYRAWSTIRNTISGPVDSARSTISNVLSKIRSAFSAIKDWMRGAFNRAWGVVKNLITSPINAAYNALNGKGGILGRIRDAFSSVVTKIGTIWDKLENLAKKPIRFIVNTVINQGIIDTYNKVAGFFGAGGLHRLTLPKGFSGGGKVDGPGTETSDSILARLSRNEFVVRAKYAIKNRPILEAINQGRPLPGYWLGGAVDWAKRQAGRAKGAASSAIDWAKEGIATVKNTAGKVFSAMTDPVGFIKESAAKVMGKIGKNPVSNIVKAMPGKLLDVVTSRVKALFGMTGGGGSLTGGGFASGGSRTPNGIGGLGPAALAAKSFVEATFGVHNIGGYANRNIAGTNTLSDHATGHAIDIMMTPDYKSAAKIALGNRIASWFVGHPLQYGTKYVIWRDQINSGSGWRAYHHPGGVENDTLQHRDHVHVSLFDKGGMLQPGLNLTMNKTRRPEPVLTDGQWNMISNAQGNVMGSTVKSMMVERVDVASLVVRPSVTMAAAIRQQTGNTVQRTNSGGTVININGNLSFPNVTNGNDADDFIKNLASVVTNA